MPLTPSEASLESKAEQIARIITKQYGVSVRVEGGMAYIDLDTMSIVLPNMTTGEMQSLSGVFDGFLDHECGHAVYTDKQAMNPLHNNSTLHGVWNTVEDFWTEREMAKQYRGCGQNVSKLHIEMNKKVESEWGKLDVLNKLTFAMSLYWRYGKIPDSYKSDPQINLLLPLLQRELEDGIKVCSTFEAVELAQRILAKIKELAEAKSPNKNGAEKEAKGGCIESKKSNSRESKGKKKAKSKGDSRKAKANKDKAKSLDNSLEKGDPAQQQAKAFQKKADANSFDKPLDAESFVNDHLMDIPDRSSHHDPEDYLIFSEEFDTEINYNLKKRSDLSEQYNKLKGEVYEYIGTMATSLELALAAESAARWVGGARRGKKFDKKRLAQWFVGGDDDRIYRQLEQGTVHDTAVSLLWDCSGSMGGSHNSHNKSALARLAAVAFHEALVRANIMHEVLGFNTGGDYNYELNDRVRAAKDRGEDLSRYCRVGELDNRFVFVPWGQTDGRALCKISGGAANRDGECVLWAAKRLAARPEIRKVLIVGSDGQPSGTDHHYTEKKYLQEIVKQVIKANIEVYAIGIKDKSVSDYYPHWVVVNDVKDLPRAVMTQLTNSLLEKQGTTYGNVPKLDRPLR